MRLLFTILAATTYDVRSMRGIMYYSYRDTLRFINVAFTVMAGAALVFDMPEAKFGPKAVRQKDQTITVAQ